MASERDDTDAGGSDAESNDDLDAPRIAQWQDDEDDENHSQETESDSEAEHPQRHIEENLSSLPLGTLRKAQRTLAREQADQSDSSSEDDEASVAGSSKGPVTSGTKKNYGSKRKNKHAPMETTSKRPVTRRRTVVEVEKVIPRDPRFLPVTGEFSEHIFRNSYGFLTESHKTELSTLRADLKRARRRLSMVGKADRSEHEAEIARLELAAKRAESSVNKDRRDLIEQNAMSQAQQAEKTKRKDGKGDWHMKKSEQKDLFVRARYDALANEGGKRAVKKAIDKKQKKVSQKEKKARPFAKAPRKRPSEGTDGPYAKRQKT